jgi:hypothetical protein
LGTKAKNIFLPLACLSAVTRSASMSAMVILLKAVCVKMVKVTSPGAQTERRGGAGPVRGLLGGKASPAALL